MFGTVVQWARSCLDVQMNQLLLPAILFSVYLYGFFLFSLCFLIFPFGLFSFMILTADPLELCEVFAITYF